MKTVLVIEDNLEVRENTAELLALEGYEVLTATNGTSGFAQMKKNKPDVVICDMMMPDTNGWEFLKLVKANQAYQNLPLIFFSAGSAPSMLKKIITENHTHYLSKPFTKEELYEIVKKSLNSEI